MAGEAAGDECDRQSDMVLAEFELRGGGMVSGFADFTDYIRAVYKAHTTGIIDSRLEPYKLTDEQLAEQYKAMRELFTEPVLDSLEAWADEMLKGEVGGRQTVRHRPVKPINAGSSPAFPAKEKEKIC